MKKEDRIDQIALFNLYSIKAEVDRVKQAIREGRLWEYTMKKARAHPKLFETIDVILNNTKFLQDGTPKFKEKAIFLFGPEDQHRPEILRYHEYVKKFRTKKKIIVITKDPTIKPVFTSYDYKKLRKRFKDPDAEVIIVADDPSGYTNFRVRQEDISRSAESSKNDKQQYRALHDFKSLVE